MRSVSEMSEVKISDSEWIVMELLWDHSPKTASEIAQALQPETGWAINTVRTLITRLVEKGALKSESAPSRRGQQFTPSIDREDVVREESQSFLNRFFKGAHESLLVHFVEQSDLSREEVEHLKHILDKSLDKKS